MSDSIALPSWLAPEDTPSPEDGAGTQPVARLSRTPPDPRVVESAQASGDTAVGYQLRSLYQGPIPVRSAAIQILAVVAIFFALTAARPFFLILISAVILRAALAPLVRSLARHRIPPPIGAGLIILALVGGGGFGVYRLSAPAVEWMNELPQELGRIKVRLNRLAGPVDRVSEISRSVESLADRPADKASIPVEIVQEQSLLQRVSSEVWYVVVQVTLVLIVVFLMLCSDGAFLRKVVRVLPTLRDKKLAVQTSHSIEREMSRYLLSIGVINLALGVVLSLAFAALGLPNPALWGTMAGLLNFIPYVGALVGVVVVSAVSTLTFEPLHSVLLPPAIYALVTFLEASLITPLVLRRSMTLSPVAIFLGLVLWSFLWGIPGAILAVPILSMTRITCEQIPSLRSVAVLLAR